MSPTPEPEALSKIRDHLIQTIVYCSDEIKRIDNILKGKKPPTGSGGAVT